MPSATEFLDEAPAKQSADSFLDEPPSTKSADAFLDEANVPQRTIPEIKETPSVIRSLGQGDIPGAFSAAKENVTRYFTQSEPGAGVKNLYDETVPAYHPEVRSGDEKAVMSNLVPGLPPVSIRQVKQGVGALGDIVHGLINPVNMATLVETAGVGALPKVGGALSRIIAGIFAEQAGESSVKSEIRAAGLPEGSAEREAAHFETAGNVAMAGVAGAGAVRGLTGILNRIYGKAEVPPAAEAPIPSPLENLPVAAEGQPGAVPAEAAQAIIEPQPAVTDEIPAKEVAITQAAEQTAPQEAPVAAEVPAEVADQQLTQEPATFDEPSATGIAQRVHEARAAAGKLGVIEPGEGVTPEDMINRGRQLVQDGADPEAVAARVNETKQVSSDDIAVLRARMEELSKTTNAAEDALSKDPNNPELKAAYEKAYQAETDWAQKAVKPAQTEWHKSGMAMQGQTDIDTGTFSGLRRAFREEKGRDATPDEQVKLRKVAEKNQAIDAEITQAKDAYDKTLETETAKSQGKRLLIDVDSLREHFAERLKDLLPCEI